MALVLAVVGLGATQGRAHPVAMWVVIAISVVGAVVTSIGLLVLNPIFGDQPVLAGLSPWWIGSLGGLATLVGAALFGLVTLVSRVLSPSAAALIAIGGLAQIVLALGIGVPEGSVAPTLIVASGAIFGVEWLWLGRNAIQTVPRAA